MMKYPSKDKPLFKTEKVVYFFIKRLFDIICSIVGILVLIPLSVVIKLCYVFTGDFHSIFYVQKRIGKDGRIFNFYKYLSNSNSSLFVGQIKLLLIFIIELKISSLISLV